MGKNGHQIRMFILKFYVYHIHIIYFHSLHCKRKVVILLMGFFLVKKKISLMGSMNYVACLLIILSFIA